MFLFILFSFLKKRSLDIIGPQLAAVEDMIAAVLVMQNDEVFRKVHSLEFQASIVFCFVFCMATVEGLKVLRNVDFCAKRAILHI